MTARKPSRKTPAPTEAPRVPPPAPETAAAPATKPRPRRNTAGRGVRRAHPLDDGDRGGCSPVSTTPRTICSAPTRSAAG